MAKEGYNSTTDENYVGHFTRHFYDGASLEDVEREQFALHKSISQDFTQKLISDIQVFEDPDVDCSSLSGGMERLFDFHVMKPGVPDSWHQYPTAVNGFPG